jgi:hypothetical protein
MSSQDGAIGQAKLTWSSDMACMLDMTGYVQERKGIRAMMGRSGLGDSQMEARRAWGAVGGASQDNGPCSSYHGLPGAGREASNPCMRVPGPKHPKCATASSSRPADDIRLTSTSSSRNTHNLPSSDPRLHSNRKPHPPNYCKQLLAIPFVCICATPPRLSVYKSSDPKATRIPGIVALQHLFRRIAERRIDQNDFGQQLMEKELS